MAANVKERLISVATSVFSVSGFRATTIREITDLVGCNVAAVNYHFGDKDKLVEAVLVGVFHPVREARDQALAAVLEKAGDSEINVEDIVAAWVVPIVNCQRDTDGGRLVVRFLQQLRAEIGSPYMRFVSQSYDYGAQNFINAFGRASPALSRMEVIWRYEMMRGAVQHALANCDPLSTKLQTLAAGGELIDVEDGDAVSREIIAVCAAMFSVSARWDEGAGAK